MKYTAFILVLFAAQVVAQTQSYPTVYTQLLSSSITLGPSAVVRNIGQSIHHLDIYGTGTNCLSGNSSTQQGQLQLEGSNDGVNFSPFGVAITGFALAPFGIYTAQAHIVAADSFQYVRLNYVRPFYIMTPTCPITAFYTGTPYGILTASQPFSAVDDGFNFFVTILTSASNASLVSCPAGLLLQVYSLIVSAPGGANKVTFEYADQHSSDTQQLPTFAFAANAPPVILPHGSRAYFINTYTTSSAAWSLAAQATAATEMDYAVSYRCE